MSSNSILTSTDTIELLYVTDGTPSTTPDRLSFDGAELSVASATAEIEQLGLGSVDCLLVADSVGQASAVEFVRRVRDHSQSVPVVAFTGDGGESLVERLLDAGVTELIRASVTDAPHSLVQRRLETVISGAESPDTQHLLSGIERLRERDTLSRQVSESINDVVWVNTLDEDGLTFVNAAYEAVWGRPREAVYDDRYSVLEGIHPEDRDRVRAAMDRQLEDPESYEETFRVVRPDGERRWIYSRAFGIRREGELERIVGVAKDVTERKHREQELAAERDLVERILETSPVGIVVHDVERNGEIVRANDQAARILGVPGDDIEQDAPAPEEITIFSAAGDPLDSDELPINRVESTGEPLWDEELIIKTPTGDAVVISVDGVPLFEDGELVRVVIAFDDVTERVDRETQLIEQRDELAQLAHINQIIRSVDKALLGATSREEILQAVCDHLSDTGRYRFALALQGTRDDRLEPTAWTGVASEFVDELFPLDGLSTETSPGKRALVTGETQVVQRVDDHETLREWTDMWQRADINALAAIPVSYEGQVYGLVSVYASGEDAFTDRELDVLDELGGTVGHAIAAVESRQRERTLTSLYEATQDLLGAETADEISEVVVDTAAGVLELPGIGVFLFDDDENVLRPAAGTDTLLDAYGGSTVFGPGKEDSVTWHTYVTGDEQFFADVRESGHAANPGTSARSSLLVPLGDHGVFVALSTETGAFDDQRRQLVRLLAATTEAALDRVAGQAGIRERERKLERRTERLEQFERVFEFVQGVNASIRSADTRAEIETSLCEQLVANDCITFAWVGRVPPDGTAIEPQAWAGSEKGYLDTVSLELGRDEPAVRAATAGDVTNVPNVTDHLRESSWASKAVDREYESVIAIPLVYGRTTYGVLTVYANTPGTFSEVVEQTATEFGETVAYGINNIETRRSILAQQVTELELRIASPETFLNAVAAVADSEVTYREMTPGSDDTAQVLFSLTDPPAADVLALESEFVAVESLTHVERGGEQFFRATLAGETVPATLLDCGSIPADVTASGGETCATVRVSQELDVRVFLDRIQERYPETELVSRRDIEQSVDTSTEMRAALEENLTERQREVLLTAYESGFFQSPRETTGEQLAELLGIAQPTVTHHLREAQRRHFTTLFDDEQ